MVTGLKDLTAENAWDEALQAARLVSRIEPRAELLLSIWRARKDPEVLEELRSSVGVLGALAGWRLRALVAIATGDPQDFDAAREAAKKPDQRLELAAAAQCLALTAGVFAQGGRIEEARLIADEDAVTSDLYWLTHVLRAIARATRSQEDFKLVLNVVNRTTGYHKNFGLSLKDMALGEIVTEWTELGELNAAAEATMLIADPTLRAKKLISLAEALAQKEKSESTPRASY